MSLNLSISTVQKRPLSTRKEPARIPLMFPIGGLIGSSCFAILIREHSPLLYVASLRAPDGEGNKMFTLEDKPILLRQGLTRVSLVASAILGETLIVEDAEKN